MHRFWSMSTAPNNALAQFLLPTGKVTNEEVRHDVRAYLYSNITWAATKRHMHAKKRNCCPGCHEHQRLSTSTQAHDATFDCAKQLL